MITYLYYVFTPTVDLLDPMKTANEIYFSDVSVWITKDHDRIGPEYAQNQIESAFWTIFLAKLVGDDPESPLLGQLRATCLRLGFTGCWSVVCTRSGGPVTELIEEACDAESFVQKICSKRTQVVGATIVTP